MCSFQTQFDSFKRPIIDTCIKTVVLSWPTFGHNMQYICLTKPQNPIKDRHCKTNSVMHFMLGSRIFFGGGGFRWISVIAGGRGVNQGLFWVILLRKFEKFEIYRGPLPLIRACIYFNYFNTGFIGKRFLYLGFEAFIFHS